MANKQLKGIKVNGTPYDINATSIGTHLTDNTGKDYILGVKEDGKLFTRDEENNEVVAGTGSGTGVGITPEQAADIEQAKSDAAAAKATADSIAGTATEAKSIAQAAQKAIEDAGIKVEGAEVLTGNSVNGFVSDIKNTNFYLYINSFYCGGDNDETSEGYCSHNYVELANLYRYDVSLDGLSLQYFNGSKYCALPLKGVIKAGSTFLIKGAPSSYVTDSFPRIKVEDEDMVWTVNNSLEYVSGGTDGIRFANVGSDGEPPIGFVLMSGGTDENNVTILSDTVNPWMTDGDATTPKPMTGFIDSIGFTGSKCFENTAFGAGNMSDVKKKIFIKYYAMDSVKQATKAIGARNNSSEWTFINIAKEDGELLPSVTVYTPKGSKAGKNIFYNKTTLELTKPTLITCSFGIQATYDDTEGAEKTATRCFNWISRDVYNEYLWVRKKDETSSWGVAHESVHDQPAQINTSAGTKNNPAYYYNRITKTYTDGKVFTAHKYVYTGLTPGVYEYVAGHKDKFGNPILERCTDIKTFVVRKNSDVNNEFTFVQTSDQQGFNWEEYRLWENACNVMTKEDSEDKIEFMINTGDMTQNGNRMSEWLDYFGGKVGKIGNIEEMATIGNNDLSPKELTKLGDGEDGSKLNLTNYTFFYTSELDINNMPLFEIEKEEQNEETGDIETVLNTYYIPSLYSFNYGNVHFLCMNSEIKNVAEKGTDSVYEFTSDGQFYPLIEEWCEKDLEDSSENRWNIVYCHEMPFTIITTSLTRDAVTTCTEEKDSANGQVGRGGSNMNTNVPQAKKYWFSEFCQKHNVRLVIGGHKHTQSTSWPLLETVKYENDTRKVYSFKPTIVLTPEELSKFFGGATGLTSVGDYKYPNTWVDENGVIKTINNIDKMASMSTFKLVSDLASDEVPVVYAMSQATSYKHTSNKELPGDFGEGDTNPGIPWLRYFYPQTKDNKANGGQQYPFYTIWKITPNQIEGSVRKVVGAFAAKGKFAINTNGDNIAMMISNNTAYGENKSVNGIYDTKAGSQTSCADVFNGLTEAEKLDIKVILKHDFNV